MSFFLDLPSPSAQPLNFIVPDFVNAVVDVRIAKSVGKYLTLELEAKGYDWILKGATAAA